MSLRVTIADVARLAGVSPSTVSHVLSGNYQHVSEATRIRVLQVIAETGYRPNAIARSLARKRTRTIGLVLAEGSARLFLAIAKGVEMAARALGYSVILAAPEGREDEEESLAVLLEKRVDGIVFLSFSAHLDSSHILAVQEYGVPLVVVNRPIPAGSVDTIRWDNCQGAYVATEHLIALGHRRIAHLSGPQRGGVPVQASVDRLNGYRAALRSHDLETDEDLATPFASDGRLHEDALAGLLRLLDRPHRPTAILAYDDVVAALALRVAAERGLRVPEDLAIVGFNQTDLATYLVPGLTTVDLPVRQAGAKAVELMVKRMRRHDDEPKEIILPCQLIVRESTVSGRPPPVPLRTEAGGL